MKTSKVNLPSANRLKIRSRFASNISVCIYRAPRVLFTIFSFFLRYREIFMLHKESKTMKLNVKS